VNRKIKKSIKYLLVVGSFLVLLYYLPLLMMGLFLCGVWDVSRNRALDAGVVRQYFLRNGIVTWLASPVNILMDVLALPFINKGVYRLEDLPLDYQEEIGSLLKTADQVRVADLVDRKTAGMKRAMYFFKWYGKDVDAAIRIPDFHRKFKFVRTIGVSVFRERESTSRHFGPFRPCLRVLYCLNENVGGGAYIRVGPVENRWRDSRLFIFDDTLLHQSFNETDDPRLVLFVDVVRPSRVPFVFDLAVSLIRTAFKGINGVFYKNWKLVNN
jgi:beta-hydroxylase